MTLPSGYTQLEWIQSSGTQYIQLNFGFNKTDEVYIKAALRQLATDKYLVSPQSWNNNHNRFAIAGWYSNKFTIGYGDASTTATTIDGTTPDQNPHEWRYSNYVFSIDNTYTKDVSSITFGGATTNLELFFGYNTNTSGVIYRYTHWKAGDMVIDLIPAKNSSNVIGMYDLVTDTFYTNSGTGTFTAGPEVIPPKVIIHGSVGTKKAIAPYSPYEWLEYIESTGTQYIDTGVIPDNITGIDITSTYLAGNGTFFGAYNSDGLRLQMYHGDTASSRVGTRIYQNSSSAGTFLTTSAGIGETYNIKIDLTNYNAIVDNGSPISLSHGTRTSIPVNLYLFAGNNNGTTVTNISAKIQLCKLYNGNTLVRDLVPARRKSDGAVGMYDKVNDVFYTNSGTGNFIAGPIKVIKTVVSVDADEFIHAYINNDYEEYPFIINFSDGSSRDIGPYLNSVECIAWHEKSEDVSRDADVDICDNIKLFYGLLTPLNTITFNAYTPKMEGSIYFIRTWDEFPYDFDPDTYPIKFFFGNNITNRLNIDFRDVYHFEYSGGGYAYEGQLWIIFYQEENTVVPLAAMPSTMCGV